MKVGGTRPRSVPNWFGGAAARDVIFNTEREGHTLISGYDLLKLAKSKPVEPNQPIFGEGESEASQALRYIGVDAQYFDLAYLPPTDNGSFTGLRQAAATLVANAQEVPSIKNALWMSASLWTALSLTCRLTRR